MKLLSLITNYLNPKINHPSWFGFLGIWLIIFLLLGLLCHSSCSQDFDWFNKHKRGQVFTTPFIYDATYPYLAINNTGYLAFNENTSPYNSNVMRMQRNPAFDGVACDTFIWEWTYKIRPEGIRQATKFFSAGAYPNTWWLTYQMSANDWVSIVLGPSTAIHYQIDTLTNVPPDTNIHTSKAVYIRAQDSLWTYTDGVLQFRYGGVNWNPTTMYPDVITLGADGTFDVSCPDCGLTSITHGRWNLYWFRFTVRKSNVTTMCAYSFNYDEEYYWDSLQSPPVKIPTIDRGDLADSGTGIYNANLLFNGQAGTEKDSFNVTPHVSNLKSNYQPLTSIGDVFRYYPAPTNEFLESYILRCDTATLNDSLNILVCGQINRINSTLPPFTDNGRGVAFVARWNGLSWVRFGTDSTIFTNLTWRVFHWGDTVYIGTSTSNKFVMQSKPPYTSWDTLGFPRVNSDIYSFGIDPLDNMLLMGGNGSVTVPDTALLKWNGASNVAMKSPPNTAIWSICTYRNELYLGTTGGLLHRKPIDSTWETINGSFTVFNLTVYQNKLFVGTTTGTNYFYDGSNLTVAGTANGFVNHITWSVVAPNQRDLYVTGSFWTINGVACNKIARYNGAVWSAVFQGGLDLRGEWDGIWIDRRNTLGNGVNSQYLIVTGDPRIISGSRTGIGLFRIDNLP